LKRNLALLKDIDRNGYEGIGKPERLSGHLLYRVHFPKKNTFSGEWGGKLFLDKGTRRVGVTLANLWFPVSIPQKHTFSVEV